MASGCSAYDAPFNPRPTLSVKETLDITRNEATVTGSITDNGGKGLMLRKSASKVGFFFVI